jgi:zinc protease
MDLELLEKVNFGKIHEIYNDRFAKPGDFTFIFVGSFSIEEVKPLFDIYLGGLPAVKGIESWNDLKIRPPKGIVEKEVVLDMETPKSTVFINLNGEIKYNIFNKIYMGVIAHVLELRYTEKIREKEGGSYGVNVNMGLSRFPVETFNLNISFDCDPKKVDKLKGIVYSEIEKLKEKGPTFDELNAAVEYFLKRRRENLRINQFWLGAIRDKYYHDINIVSRLNFDDILERINKESLQRHSQRFLDLNNHIEVILNPTEE